LAGARDLSAALLSVREQVSGPDHPDTLIARHELARWTEQAGDAVGAWRLYAGLLLVVERCLAQSTRTPWPPAPTSPAGPRGAEEGSGRADRVD